MRFTAANALMLVVLAAALAQSFAYIAAHFFYNIIKADKYELYNSLSLRKINIKHESR